LHSEYNCKKYYYDNQHLVCIRRYYCGVVDL